MNRPADADRKAQIVRALVELGGAADALIGDVLREFGVPASVTGTLLALAPGTEPPTMRDLAARLHCDPSTVSLAADKLENLDLVVRQPHPVDGRKRTLALTAQGNELWEALRTRLHASGFLAGLDAKQQGALLALLTQMRDAQPAS